MTDTVVFSAVTVTEPTERIEQIAMVDVRETVAGRTDSALLTGRGQTPRLRQPCTQRHMVGKGERPVKDPARDTAKKERDTQIRVRGRENEKSERQIRAPITPVAAVATAAAVEAKISEIATTKASNPHTHSTHSTHRSQINFWNFSTPPHATNWRLSFKSLNQNQKKVSVLPRIVSERQT